ncbi:MAG: SulP family inorganic anion transporter [Bacteroidetes bacterium]|nr:SulP family inorganic anion transporter [Rhodothermia bacterium]MCS7154598.1 SulP family inorganic anion transporter [Bacteroidota bacterium]MCX7906315.1 SulP family inorganic anion transporter [Bacteroidota bacterium]MDW8137391.1 SulP family inorganic anion transporter [Bacteroidota bacterium]MDW8285655.1 SulP family inorganic anion transporter [Bacteroidota bacterium]
MIHPPEDRIHPAPFLEDLRRYDAHKLRLDLQAGLTVAVFAIPQVMAYAILAGVPPVYGLYAAITASAVAALWGSSPFVNTGPTNSASLLTAAALSALANSPAFLELVFAFTLLVGLIRLAFGLLRLGGLVRFVPESAFLGFTIGAGLLIGLGQLHHLLGVPAPSGSWFPGRLWQTLSRLPEANPWAAGVGLGTAALLLTFERYNRRFPVALGVIGLATGLVWILAPAELALVQDIAPIPRGLPQWHPPILELELIDSLLPAALAVALLGLIEAVSIGQALALKHGQRLNFNQEFFGQGLSHVVAAFFQGIPGSGSFSRSALIEQAGGRTRLANVAYAFWIVIAVLSAGPLLERIPVASLAGLLLYIGYKLLDLRLLRRVWQTSRTDALVLGLTCAVTVLYRIEWGIFVGILVGLAAVLHRARILHLFELIPRPDGSFAEELYLPGRAHAPSALVALSVYGELFFAVAQELREQLHEIVALQRPRLILLRTRGAHSIDYACWNVLFEFAEHLERSGGKLILVGVRPDYARLIQEAGMQAVLPPEQVYPATSSLLEAFRQALRDWLPRLEEEALSPAWRAYREKELAANPPIPGRLPRRLQ